MRKYSYYQNVHEKVEINLICLPKKNPKKTEDIKFSGDINYCLCIKRNFVVSFLCFFINDYLTSSDMRCVCHVRVHIFN